MDTGVLRAFLDDCKAHPHDDARRLILADWLEEHGDSDADRARGQFLRLQCAMNDRLTAFVPKQLGRQLYELELRHGKAWAGELEAIQHRRRFYSRGLVGFYLAASTLLTPRVRAAAGGANWPWVDRVHLVGSLAPLPRLLRQPWFAGIGTLLFVNVPGSCEPGVQALLDGPDLDRLRVLSFHRLDEGSLGRLAGWAGLARLHGLRSFGGDADSSLEALTVSGMLGELRELTLYSSGVAAAGFTAVARCRELARLERLVLDSNRLDAAALKGLPASRFAGSLRRLSLHNNCDLGDAGATVLAGAPLASLERLSLDRVGLGAAGLGALAGAAWLSRLRSLTLANNPVGDAVPKLLAAPLSGLQALNLSACQLTPAALRDLADSPHLGELRHLELGWNPGLGSAAGTTMARCANLPNLESLGLAATHLGPAGVAALANWPSLARVCYLDVRSNDLDDDAVRGLLASPYRHPEAEWHLWGNTVSAGLRAEVEQRYPFASL